MASIARSNSRAGPPVYKDYVNFLAGYKGGKKDENDSGISEKSSLANSTSSISSDTPDFSKSSVTSYNTYVQNSKTKKFNPVKPNFEEKTTKKTEIYIEIQPTKTVSQVSKIFEKEQRKESPKNGIDSKISIFEKPANKQKSNYKPPKIDIFEGQKETKSDVEPLVSSANDFNTTIPPPPPPPVVSSPPKLQATLRVPQATTVTVETETVPELDRNNPVVKKLVYGALRGLYGSYHDQANGMLAAMPKGTVVRSTGVQERIEQIAANGDLAKLNGRVNPQQDP